MTSGYKKLSLGLSLMIGIFFVTYSFSLPAKSAEFSDPDTDGDGYNDILEVASGYSPFNYKPVLLKESDVDADGLSDYLELAFRTDPFRADTDADGLNDYFELAFRTNPFRTDTDGDGYNDFLEIDNSYNPLSPKPDRLERRIEIILATQQLNYYVSGIKWRSFSVSTGKPRTPTPSGEFIIVNKINKAWSRSFRLWMPFWLGFDRGRIGIHELPVWPSGFREGEKNLGRPVSGGCIRLGIGPAEYLFNRVDVGTKVLIKSQ